MRNRVVLCLIVFCSLECARAQIAAGFGTVTGIVVDAAGEGIPDIEVSLTNETLGVQRTTVTTGDGVFNITAVAPAAGYHLKVARKKTNGWQAEDLTISSGEKLDFEVSLPPEENSTEFAPRGRLRPLATQTAGLSAGLSPVEIESTPAAARRVDPLIPLAPSVVQSAQVPGTFVFHGVSYPNLLLTDGLSTTNQYSAAKPGTLPSFSLNSVQDFQVMPAGFGAEYGGTMGGIVNVATPSGFAGYHGESYGYFRSRSLQAYDRYSAGYDVRQSQQQAGANFGGPIRHDKVFFFLNFDWLNRNGQGLNRITNPLITDPSGNHVLASNCQATAAQCAIATRFLTPQLNALVPFWEHSVRGLARVDYHRSDLQAFSFDANALQWHAPGLAETEVVAPNGGLLGGPVLHEQTRYAKAGWTVTGTEATNALRVGMFQDRLAAYPSGPNPTTGLLGLSIAGANVGSTLAYPTIVPSERRFQLVDDANWSVGSHILKAGVQVSRSTDHIESLNNAAGWYTYPSLTAFAQDFGLTGSRSYTTYTQTLGTAPRNLALHEINVYAQDTWRATGRLTLDYGLRYEHQTLPQPNQTNTSYYLTGTLSSPWLNLSPRFGFSYLLDQHTVFRGGFGFYYAPFPAQLVDALFLGNGINQTSITATPTLANAPVFPNTVLNTSAIPSGATDVLFANSKIRNPYTQQTTLALERELPAGTTVTLSYLHSRGLKLWTTQDTNLVPSSETVTYTILDAGGQPAGTYSTPYWTAKANSAYAHVYEIDNYGSSWYDSVSLQFRKRMSHGLSLTGNYTWSHAIDDAGQGGPFGTLLPNSTSSDYSADRGNSPYDQRHRAAIQWLWQPRIPAQGALGHAVNGWQVSSITTLGSSMHATPLVMVQGQQFSSLTAVYTNSLNGSGGWARVPFLPVSSLATGPQYNVDARLSRRIAITERVQATLLFEAFNVFNTQFNTSVNTIAYTAVSALAPGLANGPHSGVLMPVAGAGNGNASQGFPDGTNARRAQFAVRIGF